MRGMQCAACNTPQLLQEMEGQGSPCPRRNASAIYFRPLLKSLCVNRTSQKSAIQGVRRMECNDIACQRGSPTGGAAATAKCCGLRDPPSNAEGWAFGRFPPPHERSELDSPIPKSKSICAKTFENRASPPTDRITAAKPLWTAAALRPLLRGQPCRPSMRGRRHLRKHTRGRQTRTSATQ